MHTVEGLLFRIFLVFREEVVVGYPPAGSGNVREGVRKDKVVERMPGAFGAVLPGVVHPLVLVHPAFRSRVKPVTGLPVLDSVGSGSAKHLGTEHVEVGGAEGAVHGR